jgi:pyruvate dehydrogenase E2 component (dihydrolipoamide acetyltransferase)
MAHLILMPKAGQSMTEGRVVAWLKKEGDAVARGEPLLEIETDKANLEVEAPESGVLRRIFVAEGEVCDVLAPVGVLGGAGEEIDFEALRKEGAPPSSAAADAAAKKSAGAALAAAAPRGEPARSEPAAGAALAPSPAAPLAGARAPEAGNGAASVAGTLQSAAAISLPPRRDAAGRRVAASPLARRLAAERGIDLQALRGSGPGGRILRRDVEAAPPAATAGNGQAALLELRGAKPYPPPSPRPPSRVPLGGMRRAIASALQQSKSSIPHFYATMAIDMAAALSTRSRHEREGRRITVNDLVLAACARALVDEPRVNCRVSDEHIDYPQHANIGIAVGSDEGLIVPVILRAERYELAALAEESRRVIELAQAGKLVGAGQGTFTVSNLGMFGVESFTAIINPPEGAILAVGAIAQQLVPAGGGFFPRPILRVTLSADHRAIDGLLAARFLARLKHLLESGL